MEREDDYGQVSRGWDSPDRLGEAHDPGPTCYQRMFSTLPCDQDGMRGRPGNDESARAAKLGSTPIQPPRRRAARPDPSSGTRSRSCGAWRRSGARRRSVATDAFAAVTCALVVHGLTISAVSAL